jgi:mRNA-degrading endonuclease RelE of RelBE toxin-antitoxin system
MQIEWASKKGKDMPKPTSHRWWLIVDPTAQVAFSKLSPSTRRTIFRGLEQLLTAEAPYEHEMVTMLKDKRFNRARKFRAGDYRVIFVLDLAPVRRGNYVYKGSLVVIDIGSRQGIYG